MMGPARLAALILAPVLLIVLAAVTASVISLSSIPADTAAATQTGVARVGDDLALVIVTDPGHVLTGIRETIADWGLLVPALGLAGAALMAWMVAGRIQGDVDDARRRVALADRDRESRLQEIVHELRTPLAVLGTNLELAQTETDADKYMDAARRAVGRMSRIVDDLAGHGHLAISDTTAPVDLAAIAEEAVTEQSGHARTRGVYLSKHGDDHLVVPAVDRAAVQAALGNFMSNAVRMAPRGSVITIGWGQVSGGWAWMSVTDQGPGIPPHHHARVFERGWQGAHDRDRRDGAGLGLTIARQLTEAQGGAVTVESEEGGGATFALWLPVENGADRSAVVATDQVHPAVRPWAPVPASA